MKRCLLEKDINHCGSYDAALGLCMAENVSCSFQEKDKPGQPFSERERAEKWYEKYHKGTRPIR